MNIRYTRRAARQLDAILDHIEAHSPQGADRVFNRIEAILALLAEQPRSGRPTRRLGFRRIVIHPYPYVILYQPTADEIVIHSVRHAARKPRGW